MLFFSRDWNLLENIGAFVRFRQKKVLDVKIKQFFKNIYIKGLCYSGRSLITGLPRYL